jgi:predicted RNA-binding protein (virulence factor B family)
MEIGTTQKLKAVKVTAQGYHLEDETKNEIILPKTEVINSLDIGDFIEVFVYKNPKGTLVATTKKPLVELDEFAYLKVKKVTNEGAFLDWGLDHDLLVPVEEQLDEMEEGKGYLIFVLKDEKTEQLFGSCNENEFVFFDEIDLKVGDEVDLLLYKTTDLGMNAIVNNKYKGLIFRSDIHRIIQPGNQIKGYVKQVREDGKIDLLLEPLGYKKSIDKYADIILEKLAENNGFLDLTDKSNSETIKYVLGMSKKAFKRTIGNLYKNKKITIQDDGIHSII